MSLASATADATASGPPRCASERSDRDRDALDGQIAFALVHQPLERRGQVARGVLSPSSPSSAPASSRSVAASLRRPIVRSRIAAARESLQRTRVDQRRAPHLIDVALGGADHQVTGPGARTDGPAPPARRAARTATPLAWRRRSAPGPTVVLTASPSAAVSRTRGSPSVSASRSALARPAPPARDQLARRQVAQHRLVGRRSQAPTRSAVPRAGAGPAPSPRARAPRRAVGRQSGAQRRQPGAVVGRGLRRRPAPGAPGRRSAAVSARPRRRASPPATRRPRTAASRPAPTTATRSASGPAPAAPHSRAAASSWAARPARARRAGDRRPPSPFGASRLAQRRDRRRRRVFSAPRSPAALPCRSRPTATPPAHR